MLHVLEFVIFLNIKSLIYTKLRYHFVLHQLATARITALSEVSEYNTGLFQCNHSIASNNCDSGLKLRMILSKH